MCSGALLNLGEILDQHVQWGTAQSRLLSSFLENSSISLYGCLDYYSVQIIFFPSILFIFMAALFFEMLTIILLIYPSAGCICWRYFIFRDVLVILLVGGHLVLFFSWQPSIEYNVFITKHLCYHQFLTDVTVCDFYC